VAQCEAHGLDGLRPRSRAPHHHPNAVSEEVSGAVLRAKAAEEVCRLMQPTPTSPRTSSPELNSRGWHRRSDGYVRGNTPAGIRTDFSHAGLLQTACADARTAVDDSDIGHCPALFNAMQLPLKECYSESLLLFPRLTLFGQRSSQRWASAARTVDMSEFQSR